MRGLAIVALILTLLVIMLPFVVSFLIFVILAVGVFMLLARTGFLPGFVFKTYRFHPHGDPWAEQGRRRASGQDANGKTTSSHNARRRRTDDDGDRRSPAETIWYQDDQEGEIITLPETALKKDGE
ncbi:MAG: hypothetical protein LBF92_05095 [Synergistaceae bacterium]|nr:hypothetical protein [Synergistaceae bacterium]